MKVIAAFQSNNKGNKQRKTERKKIVQLLWESCYNFPLWVRHIPPTPYPFRFILNCSIYIQFNSAPACWVNFRSSPTGRSAVVQMQSAKNFEIQLAKTVIPLIFYQVSLAIFRAQNHLSVATRFVLLPEIIPCQRAPISHTSYMYRNYSGTTWAGYTSLIIKHTHFRCWEL